MNASAIAQTLYVSLLKDATVIENMKLSLRAMFNHYLDKLKRYGAKTWERMTQGQRISIGYEFSRLVKRYADSKSARVVFVTAKTPMKRYTVTF